MFSYSEDSSEPVLKDIDIHIRPGETIGVIGGTGSAKSSLINLIPRLYDVNEGSVFVGGRDVREYDLEALRGILRPEIGPFQEIRVFLGSDSFLPDRGLGILDTASEAGGR